MATTETLIINNPLGAADWVQVADETHEVVQFASFGSPAPVPIIWIGDTLPTGGNGYPVSGARVQVQHANEKVWALIQAGATIVVIRGDAKVSIS